MRGDTHVRFGGRAEETGRRKRRHRASVRPNTEHPTREGKRYCAVVLEVFSRRVVGWSIDSAATAALVTSALGMAIDTRTPAGTIVHSDQGLSIHVLGVHRAGQGSGLDALHGLCWRLFDNAVIESFWSRRQVELLDRRRRWNTRVELANPIFEYLEVFHNRQRRHSPLGMLTPFEYENRQLHRLA